MVLSMEEEREKKGGRVMPPNAHQIISKWGHVIGVLRGGTKGQHVNNQIARVELHQMYRPIREREQHRIIPLAAKPPQKCDAPLRGQGSDNRSWQILSFLHRLLDAQQMSIEELVFYDRSLRTLTERTDLPFLDCPLLTTSRTPRLPVIWRSIPGACRSGWAECWRSF